MKKRMLALLLSALMVMSLAACGSDAQEEAPADNGGEESGEATTVNAPLSTVTA